MGTTALDYYAQRHAGFLHGAGRMASAQLLRMLAPLAGTERLLELGCGTGASLVMLHQNFPNLQLSGGDISPLMCRKARQRIRFCGLEQAIDIVQLPTATPYQWPAESFEVVWIESVLAIQSSEQLQLLLKELFRLLKPGGRIAINETIWDEETPLAIIHTFNEACKAHFGIIQANADYAYRADWEQLLEEIGFVQIKMDPVTDNRALKISSSWRSRIFDAFGKLSSMFHPKLRRQAAAIAAAEATLHQAGTAKMVTYLMVAEKPAISNEG